MKKTKIVVESFCKGQYRYIADRPDECGSPVVGYGKTPLEAIGDLILNDQETFGIEISVTSEE